MKFQCPRCKKYKLLSEFNKNKWDYYNKNCIDCILRIKKNKITRDLKLLFFKEAF